MFAYIRQQEDQADRAGVKFLTATGQSAKGMSDTFSGWPTRLSTRPATSNPYMQSHPLPAERVRALEGMARQSPYWDKKELAGTAGTP